MNGGSILRTGLIFVLSNDPVCRVLHHFSGLSYTEIGVFVELDCGQHDYSHSDPRSVHGSGGLGLPSLTIPSVSLSPFGFPLTQVKCSSSDQCEKSTHRGLKLNRSQLGSTQSSKLTQVYLTNFLGYREITLDQLCTDPMTLSIAIRPLKKSRRNFCTLVGHHFGRAIDDTLMISRLLDRKSEISAPTFVEGLLNEFNLGSGLGPSLGSSSRMAYGSGPLTEMMAKLISDDRFESLENLSFSQALNQVTTELTTRATFQHEHDQLERILSLLSRHLISDYSMFSQLF